MTDETPQRWGPKMDIVDDRTGTVATLDIIEGKWTIVDIFYPFDITEEQMSEMARNQREYWGLPKP